MRPFPINLGPQSRYCPVRVVLGMLRSPCTPRAPISTLIIAAVSLWNRPVAGTDVYLIPNIRTHGLLRRGTYFIFQLPHLTTFTIDTKILYELYHVVICSFLSDENNKLKTIKFSTSLLHLNLISFCYVG